MRSQFPLFIVIIVAVLIVLLAQEKFYQNVYDIEINGEVKPRSLKSVRDINGVLYLAVTYLEKNAGMSISVNKDDGQITLSHDSRSVTLRIDEKEALKKGRKYFINLRRLLEELGGRYVWDKDNKILVIEF